MPRNIFIVNAYIVDANGAFNPMTGYPKTFDSKNYDNDIEKAQRRAVGEFSDTFGAMCKRDDRQLQTVILMCADGAVLDTKHIGTISDVPEAQE